MPKYWGKHIFSHGSFPEVGEKQKAEKKKKKKKKEEEKVGENNGQLCFVRQHVWRTPGPKEKKEDDGNNNGQLLIANATSGGAHKAAWAKTGQVLLTTRLFGAVPQAI